MIKRVSFVALLTALNLSLSLYAIGFFCKSGYVKIHLLYMAGVFLVFPLILFSQWMIRRWKINISPKILAIFWIALACILIARGHFLFFPVAYIVHSGYWFLYLLWGILILLCCFNKIAPRFKQVIYYLLILQIIFLALTLFKEYLFFFNNTPNLVNFNAVFSSVVQAVHGKLPLVDYYAQYGYYSGLLSLIFRVIPLTLMTYSAVLSILVLLVFVFLFLGLRKVILNPFLRLIVLMACFYGEFYYAQIVYWAVLPIRLIFPFLSFWLIAWYTINKSSRLYHLIFLIVTLSLTWNMDTGAVLFLSWLLYLSYIAMPSVKSLLKIWLTGVVYVAALLGLYAGITWIARGVFPHYTDIFIFQEVFFGQGFASLPMKPFDTWSLLMLVYLVGFVYAFHKKAPLVFFLCLMGVGIFSYFVMRSYFENIFVVTWPALILLGIFAETMMTTKRFGLAFLAIFPLTLWSLSSMASALSPGFSPTQTSLNYWKYCLQQRAWVKSLGLENKNVVIISDKSGIFYMDTKSSVPIVIPGATELVSPVFIHRIVQYAENKHSHGFLLVDTKMPGYTFPLLTPLRKLVVSLPVIKKSPDGGLILYGIHDKL